MSARVVITDYNGVDLDFSLEEVLAALGFPSIGECDCPMDPYHRWNCNLTPLWAQTIRDLDVNPWTVMKASSA